MGYTPKSALSSAPSQEQVVSALGFTPSPAAHSHSDYAPASHTHGLEAVSGITATRILGRVTADFGPAEELTGAQVAAMLPEAATNAKGLMSAADKTKLNGLGGMSWVKLAADGAATTSNTVYTASALTFTALANTTYIVELNGSFLTAATTTGISAVLDIPSGVVMGNFMHTAAATQTMTGTEQVADNASPQTGTSGVRAANTQTSMLGRWIVEIGATGGAVTLGYRSEISGSSVTLKKPTALGYQAI